MCDQVWGGGDDVSEKEEEEEQPSHFVSVVRVDDEDFVCHLERGVAGEGVLHSLAISEESDDSTMNKKRLCSEGDDDDVHVMDVDEESEATAHPPPRKLAKLDENGRRNRR